MPNIFNYFDFRKYLHDYYEEMKKNKSSFSYQSFTQKCGFKNKSFLHQIIHTRKKISKSSIYNISKAIGHSKKEAFYFENLVAFNQARTVDEKNHYFKAITKSEQLFEKHNPLYKVKKDQFEYYSRWYHGVIRALIAIYPVHDNYQWIARNLFPSISLKEAKKSIELLCRLDFIRMNKNGYYEITDKIITTGDEVISTAVLNFHRESTQLALNAIDKLPRTQRNITGLMIGISESTYQEICQKMSDFRKELLDLVQSKNNAESVYQLNFHLFPVSNPRLKAHKKEEGL